MLIHYLPECPECGAPWREQGIWVDEEWICLGCECRWPINGKAPDD